MVKYNGVEVNPATEMGKELLKWERRPDYRPENNPFPAMMYHAQRGPNGKVKVFEDIPPSHGFTPDALTRELARVEAFNRDCQKTVMDEYEHREALNAGWRDSPQEAVEEFERQERKIGDLAAERAFHDSKMSPAAQAEAAEADAATEFHLPEVPEKRRGRPRKVA